MDTPKNNIGLIDRKFWSDMCGGDVLLDQLKNANIPHETVDIPHLVGMGGCAYFTFYAHPKTGKPRTVLCVPMRGDIDSFAESYYYFEMTKEQALESEPRWLEIYDECRRIDDEAFRASTEENNRVFKLVRETGKPQLRSETRVLCDGSVEGCAGDVILLYYLPKYYTETTEFEIDGLKGKSNGQIVEIRKHLGKS